MDEKKPFGEYIRKKRLESGQTQKQLADALFVAESTVSKWERCLQSIRYIAFAEHTLHCICRVYVTLLKEQQFICTRRVQNGSYRLYRK